MLLNSISILCCVYMLYVAVNDKFVLHAKYHDMPRMYDLDNYNECMERNDALYCTIQIQLYHNDSWNVSSDAWDVIQEVNADEKHYFRHDIIHRGICSSDRCNLTKDLYTSSDESKVVDILYNCVAGEFKEKYNLSTIVSIEKCKYHKYEVINNKQWSFLVIICLLITLCIMGCFVKKEDAYKGIIHRILLAFSLRENWRTLLRRCNMGSNSTTSPTYLYGIQGVRALLMMFIIMIHIFFFIINSDNPEALEWLYGSDNTKLFYNGPALMQIFLCISGFLLTYHFIKVAQKRGNIHFAQYPQLILQRWLRFTPVNLLTISYIVAWSSRVNGDNPLHRLFRMEEEACSKYWWNNLMYINNRNYEVFKCMPHTWYLAVDMQLYCVMSLLLIVIWKLKHLAAYILGGALLISMTILSYYVYANNYGPVMLVTPEGLRTAFEHNATFRELYIKAYSNSTSYIVGMIAAYLHYKMEDKKLQLRYYKWLEVASRAVAPVTVCTIFSGSLVLDYGSLVGALYNPLNKAVISGGVAIFLIAVATKTEYFQKNFLESSPMLLLGSLSFPSMMIHLAIQTYLSASMEVFHISFYSIMKFFTLSMVLTYSLALVVHLIVEMPFCNLEKIFLTRRRHIMENCVVKKTE